jgi:hypothetical protein
MAKAKGRRGRAPRPKAEPTVRQARDEWKAAKAQEQMLDDLGIVVDEQPVPKYDLEWGGDVRDAIDRLEILYALYRWTVLRGVVPEPADWEATDDWPLPSHAEALFGSWDELIDASGIDSSVLGHLVERTLAAYETLRTRDEEHRQEAGRLAEESERQADLRRQLDAHKARRDEADARAAEAEGARDRALRDGEALADTVARLHGELAAAMAANDDIEPITSQAEYDELLEGFEQTLADQSRSQAERDELHTRLERVAAERERDRATIAELATLLARFDVEAGGDDRAPDAEPEAPPATVLEAVQRAADESKHLRFAPRAFETAAESPFRRPGLVLRTLRQLDELAALYAQGDIGMSLSQAAQRVGITQWRSNVSELARTRYAKEYTFTYEGHELPIGPHIGLGSGSGAAFIARIYLHVADEGDAIGRGIVVAVVGRHLPDTTT